MIIFLFLLSLFPLWAKERPVSSNIKCLSYHHIQSASKAKLGINQEYLFTSVYAALECTDCDPGMIDKMAESKIHTKRNQKKSAASDGIKQIFIWIMFVGWLFILFVVVVLTIIGFFLGPIREMIRLKNKFTKIKRNKNEDNQT